MLQDQQCAKDPTCFGIWDSINSFIGTFANWLGVAAGVGATLGVVQGLVTGASWTGIALLCALGASLTASFVVVFTGGYLVGTAINGGIEWVMYRNP